MQKCLCRHAAAVEAGTADGVRLDERDLHSKLRAAYLALVDGGVKSYVIDDRELTRFDLPDLKNEIEDAEKKVDELLAELNGRKPRKAFGIIPRDW